MYICSVASGYGMYRINGPPCLAIYIYLIWENEDYITSGFGGTLVSTSYGIVIDHRCI